MNRRDLVRAAATAVTLTMVPTVALAGVPAGVLQISAEAAKHPHLDHAMKWIGKLLDDGHIIAQEMWPIDIRVDLKNPRFEVDLGRAWDFQTGYKSGLTGPRVKVFEGDVKVLEGEMFHYTGEALRDEVDPLQMIARNFEDVAVLRAKLPTQVSYDNSRFIASLDAYAKGKAAA